VLTLQGYGWVLRKGVRPERRPDSDNEEHHDWFFSPNIIRAMKSRRMMSSTCGAREGEGKGNACTVPVGNPDGRKRCEELYMRWEDVIKTDCN
jgi:hypothetical protein